jgi:hypothetical protein
VELVAYCTEEPPFFGTRWMGSYHHAEERARAGVPVRAMLCLEMVGYFSDRFGSQTYPMPLLHLYYPARGNFIAVVGNTRQRGLLRRVKAVMKGATDLPVWSASAPGKLPGVDFSDHRNYWAFGVPAVMVTDMAFYRNRAYHTERDTWDRLDYQRMAKVVGGVHRAVTDLAAGAGAE